MAAVAAGGSWAQILAEVGPPNKSIFVPSDKRLQLERWLGLQGGAEEGSGGVEVQMLQHTKQRSLPGKRETRESVDEVREVKSHMLKFPLHHIVK